jgi:hypothetical protein
MQLLKAMQQRMETWIGSLATQVNVYQAKIEANNKKTEVLQNKTWSNQEEMKAML